MDNSSAIARRKFEVLVSYGPDAEARILRKSEDISARVTQKGIAGLVDRNKDHPAFP